MGLTTEEKQLLALYRQADSRRKELVLDLARVAAEAAKNKPDNPSPAQAADVIDLLAVRARKREV
jgi:hypothetical protein